MGTRLEQASFVIVQEPSQLLGLVGEKHGEAGGRCKWPNACVTYSVWASCRHMGGLVCSREKASLELEAGHSGQQQTSCARLVL